MNLPDNTPSSTPSPPQVIALTGGIGSGKSSVATLFERWGAYVVSADELARSVVQPGTPGLAAVITRFGNSIITPSGELDRKALGAVIFADPTERTALEEILHPLIRQGWLARLAAIRSQIAAGAIESNPIIYEVPLLLESGSSYPEIDQIVLVTAPVDLRIERVVRRDHCSPESAHQRITAQLSDKERARISDYIITNDGPLESLERQARAVFEQLSSGSAHDGGGSNRTKKV